MPKLSELQKHIETLNREMGQVQTDIKWLKESMEKIDRRTWWILGSIVAFGIISIAIALMG